jgi:predicted esterase
LETAFKQQILKGYFMRKTIAILLFCLSLTLAACDGPQAVSSPPVGETATVPVPASDVPPTPVSYALSSCTDYERIKVGDYILNNNVWNKGDRTDYTQCIFAQSDTPPAAMGWRWDWPGDAREIQTYPEVMFGDSPWDAESPTGGLPLPVSGGDLLVTYDASIEATGKWNVAFEMWLTSDPAPAEQNITDEVMIWVARSDLMPGPLVYDIVAFDDITYTVHIAPGHGDASGGSSATWDYIAFVTRKPLLSGILNMGHFLDYLVEKQVIEQDRYVASLELGTEIESGKGEFNLSTYKITSPAAESVASENAASESAAIESGFVTPEDQDAESGRITNIPGLPPTYYEATYGKLTYGLYVPENYDPSKSYPLIMHLHGYSYLNSDNLWWYAPDIQARNPCFVFTPKTPPSWGDWSGWGDTLSEPMQVTMEVLDQLIAEYSIDECRLYVYGISMGGEGTFDLLDKYPDKFAAAMSVCGGGLVDWAENIAKTPLWMFHGSQDEVVPPRLTEDVYHTLVAMGATRMRYTNYPGMGHAIWDLAASEPAWTEWMFAHSKCDTTCPPPTGKLTLELTRPDADTLRLTWNDIRNRDEKANQIWYYKVFRADELIGTTEFDQTTFDILPEQVGGTYAVQAVNCCFGESGISNMVSDDD